MGTKKIDLSVFWEMRLKLLETGNKLQDKGNKEQLEGKELWEKGHNLWIMANELWEKIVKQTYGDIKLKWDFDKEKQDFKCILETGEVFKP